MLNPIAFVNPHHTPRFSGVYQIKVPQEQFNKSSTGVDLLEITNSDIDDFFSQIEADIFNDDISVRDPLQPYQALLTQHGLNPTQLVQVYDNNMPCIFADDIHGNHASLVLAHDENIQTLLDQIIAPGGKIKKNGRALSGLTQQKEAFIKTSVRNSHGTIEIDGNTQRLNLNA